MGDGAEAHKIIIRGEVEASGSHMRTHKHTSGKKKVNSAQNKPSDTHSHTTIVSISILTAETNRCRREN